MPNVMVKFRFCKSWWHTNGVIESMATIPEPDQSDLLHLSIDTRAGLEYVIPDNPGTEVEILARIEKLVGAYLNAARNGQKQLEEAYNEAAAKQKASSRGWVPVFEATLDGAAEITLKEFDISEDGYELFPFNRERPFENSVWKAAFIRTAALFTTLGKAFRTY